MRVLLLAGACVGLWCNACGGRTIGDGPPGQEDGSGGSAGGVSVAGSGGTSGAGSAGMPGCAPRELKLEGVVDGKAAGFRDTTANAEFTDATAHAPGQLFVDCGPGGNMAVEFDEPLGERGSSVARALVQLPALGAVVESCGAASESRIVLDRGVLQLQLRSLSPLPGCNRARLAELNGCFGLR